MSMKRAQTIQTALLPLAFTKHAHLFLLPKLFSVYLGHTVYYYTFLRRVIMYIRILNQIGQKF